MKIKASDYIVQYLIDRGVTDVFGYPGGMVTHIMDSLGKMKDHIAAHVTYHEQGAAFAACGYAQTSGKIGVAYATSGPGATNMITGICHAYFDSIPVLFITGQVNTFESNEKYGLRQRGFQETDIVAMVQSVTKFAAYVDSADKLKSYLDEAYYHAMQGRKGPVLLDIPMNIQRAEVDDGQLPNSKDDNEPCASADFANLLRMAFEKSQRPCLLIGHGVFSAGKMHEIRNLLKELRLPIVTSMLAFNIAPPDLPIGQYNYGFIGAYGDRCANFVVAKSDLLITLGSRLDVRQVGAKREQFAPDATIFRIDIDEKELSYGLHKNDIGCHITLSQAIEQIRNVAFPKGKYEDWLEVCRKIREKLNQEPLSYPLSAMKEISLIAPESCIVTGDVGQNQVWIAQAFQAKSRQQFLIPGGHSAMGCSLPSAIGAYYGSHKAVLCFSGDGGLQMNIQELQTVVREKLPIKIIVMNNFSLGMIRHFQEMYFHSIYVQTTCQSGYTVPDFCAIARAYGLSARKVTSLDEIEGLNLDDGVGELIEVLLPQETYVFPKLEFGKPNQDQEPLLDRELYEELMAL